MAVEVRLTAVLQKLTGGAKVIPADGATVGEVLDSVEARFPGFKNQVSEADGALKRFVNIYLNDEDVRYLGALDTPTQPGDVISVLPALAGG